MTASGYVCRACGQHHTGLPLAWGADAPEVLRQVPRPEWRSRVKLTSDVCRLDRRRYFVRACLMVPIRERGDAFGHLVWVELARDTYRDVRSVWRELRGKPFPPYAGQLASALPYAQPTLGTRVTLHWTGSGRRPDAVVDPSQHEVGRDQREGISVAQAYAFASAYHHAFAPPGSTPDGA
jgi:hypothetical protein